MYQALTINRPLWPERISAMTVNLRRHWLAYSVLSSMPILEDDRPGYVSYPDI